MERGGTIDDDAAAPDFPLAALGVAGERTALFEPLLGDADLAVVEPLGPLGEASFVGFLLAALSLLPAASVFDRRGDGSFPCDLLVAGAAAGAEAAMELDGAPAGAPAAAAEGGPAIAAADSTKLAKASCAAAAAAGAPESAATATVAA